MKAPENCWKCEYNNNCRSYYGGSLCKHKDEINRAIISKTLEGEGKAKELYGQLSLDLDDDEDNDYTHDYEEDGDEE